MARKKKDTEQNKKKINTDGVMGLVGSTTEQAITETLESNYMPYAMSVIVSRAIPEIDGFKPSHRNIATPSRYSIELILYVPLPQCRDWFRIVLLCICMYLRLL